MAKQQSLTIVVADDMADPADLVESALSRLDVDRFDPAIDDPSEIDDHGLGYMIIEED